MTELHRNTKAVVGPVMSGQNKVIITDHGKPVLDISPHEDVEVVSLEELRRCNWTPDEIVKAVKASRH